MVTRTSPVLRKLDAWLAGAEPVPPGVLVRFEARRGTQRELCDLIPLLPLGSLAAVYGVGRVLRLLRAGRIRAPDDPDRLGCDLAAAAALLDRCRGARVVLGVRRRFERAMTVWTEAGVERIERVVDFREDASGLAIWRQGAHSALRLPRERIIRYATSSSDALDILSIEAPPRTRPGESV
jgi:hypothetical protein